MNVVYNQYEKIKGFKEEENEHFNIEEIEKIKNDIIRNKTSKELWDIFIFIDKNKDISEVLMMRFRENIKEIRNNYEKPYKIINQYKEKILNIHP